ncbi:type III-B CRISPR module RAMP protein Cmr1 [Thermocrinis sp.]|uniref:type III-B CRISPR module RAMP protein Cmr1 n=1 Tax=Thermocrinis sp. TaxID=2024383 RepID=UPI003BFDDF66
MKRLTFDLEFITPAFIGGANQQAELRPASFVGLLRWWWRALKGECDIKRLREEEIKIFGGDGKMASPVYLRVEGDVSKGSDLINEYKLSWNFDKNRRALTGSHAGVGYLYYSMVALNRREFIKADSKLKLILVGKDDVLKHHIASLWALVFLGGVGARSRRGGGNLTVIDYNPKDLGISFIPTSYFDEWLVENLKRAKDLVGCSKTPCNEYSNLKNVKLVLSPREFNTWVEALNDIGNRFMNFRVKNRQRVFDTAVFGIPVRHSNGQFVRAEDDITRRSSPVIIKVVKTPKGKYLWMALWLWGKFLPNGVKLSFMGKTQEPSFKLIEEFFQELEGGAKK